MQFASAFHSLTMGVNCWDFFTLGKIGSCLYGFPIGNNGSLYRKLDFKLFKYYPEALYRLMGINKFFSEFICPSIFVLSQKPPVSRTVH